MLEPRTKNHTEPTLGVPNMNWKTAGKAMLLTATLLLDGRASLVAEPPNEHANPGAKYLHAAAGDLVDVKLADLHPTQAVLGIDEVYYKLGRYQAGKDLINKRFGDWCEANGQQDVLAAMVGSGLDKPASFSCMVPLGSETPATVDPMKTVVIGRGGRLYLVDGHHTFTAFMESPDGGANMQVRVRVLANLSRMGPREFWREMETSDWVWLRDENNLPIEVEDLPGSLGIGNFRNDDYRSLVYFMRDIAYRQNAQNANYQEFHWGAWLRTNPAFDLGTYDLADLTQYLDAVKRAAELMSALSDTDVVDGCLTAKALGRIPFNAGEFAKLSRTHCSSKPGKVAYANYYYHNILGAPPVVTCP
jgi:hypothetical protein